MSAELFIFGGAAAAMVAGAAVFLLTFSIEDGGVDLYVVPALVPLVAGAAYTAMALHSAGVVGDVVREARYLDWLITTPLVVFVLARVAGVDSGTRVRAMALDAAMIGLGYAASTATGRRKWLLFALSAAAFLGLVSYLGGALSRAAAGRPPAVEAMFVGLRDLTIFLWAAYPLLWVLGPEGVGVLRLLDYHLLTAGLDVAAKVGFDFLIVFRASGIRETLGPGFLGSAADRAAGEVT